MLLAMRLVHFLGALQCHAHSFIATAHFSDIENDFVISGTVGFRDAEVAA